MEVLYSGAWTDRSTEMKRRIEIKWDGTDPKSVEVVAFVRINAAWQESCRLPYDRITVFCEGDNHNLESLRDVKTISTNFYRLSNLSEADQIKILKDKTHGSWAPRFAEETALDLPGFMKVVNATFFFSKASTAGNDS